MPSSGELVRLESTGRRTGRPHNVLLRFITVDGRIVVFPQTQGNQDWVANIRQSPQVNVYWEAKTVRGWATVKHISGLRDPLLGIFTRKYGNDEVRRRYWGQTMFVEIEVLGEKVENDYLDLMYSELEAAFDGVAEHYDEHILGNPMNLWLRNRSVHHLLRTFNRGQVVLEIGCGTGTETLSVARAGVRVIACDISSKMLNVLERKAASQGLSDMVIPVHARPYALPERLRAMGYAEIDGAYSTYGAVNTEPRLDRMFQDIHGLMRPGGKLVLGVWNKFCLFEIAGYSLRLKPSMAVARLRNPVPVGKSRFCIASDAYSVGSLDRVISPFFRLEEVYGVEIFLPPSNLTRYLPSGRLLEALKHVETGIEGSFPWNRLGDHFLGIYSRVD